MIVGNHHTRRGLHCRTHHRSKPSFSSAANELRVRDIQWIRPPSGEAIRTYREGLRYVSCFHWRTWQDEDSRLKGDGIDLKGRNCTDYLRSPWWMCTWHWLLLTDPITSCRSPERATNRHTNSARPLENAYALSRTVMDGDPSLRPIPPLIYRQDPWFLCTSMVSHRASFRCAFARPRSRASVKISILEHQPTRCSRIFLRAIQGQTQDDFQ